MCSSDNEFKARYIFIPGVILTVIFFCNIQILEAFITFFITCVAMMIKFAYDILFKK
jgi:hypothetical protein